MRSSSANALRLTTLAVGALVMITPFLYMLSTIVGELLCFVGLFATLPFGLYVHGHYLGRHVAWLDAQEGVG